MIDRIEIKRNDSCPLPYVQKIEALKNGSVYKFNPGVNIVIGENGSGKTTLMKLIECYLMVDKEECSRGLYNDKLNSLFGFGDVFLDGIDVYADYKRNIFRLCHPDERDDDENMKDFAHFGEAFEIMHSSKGEGVSIAIQSMFKRMFSKGSRLYFDYENEAVRYSDYIDYIKKHRVDGNEWTILMDEPDRNLDIGNAKEILGVLSYHKPKIQIIATIHNPLLIYALSKLKYVNIIEMSDGYKDKIINEVNSLIK